MAFPHYKFKTVSQNLSYTFALFQKKWLCTETVITIHKIDELAKKPYSVTTIIETLYTSFNVLVKRNHWFLFLLTGRGTGILGFG